MNSWGGTERRQKSRRSRAIAPIIATILLVAMTVILAAVLYVLITGFLQSPGNRSIGGAFTAAHATPGTCAAGSSQTLGAVAISGGCHPGDFTYILTIESSTISFGSVLFVVKTMTGATFSGGGVSSSFALLNLSSRVAAISVTGATMGMNVPWLGYGPTTTSPTTSAITPLTDQYGLVIDMGSSTPTTGQGLSIVAIGTGSYSGTTSPTPLP